MGVRDAGDIGPHDSNKPINNPLRNQKTSSKCYACYQERNNAVQI